MTSPLTTVTFGPVLADSIARMKFGREPRECQVIDQAIQARVNDATRSALLPPWPTPCTLTLDCHVGTTLKLTFLGATSDQKLAVDVPYRQMSGFLFRYWETLKHFTQARPVSDSMRQAFEQARAETHHLAGSFLLEHLSAATISASRPFADSVFNLFVYTYPDPSRNPSVEVSLKLAKR